MINCTVVGSRVWFFPDMRQGIGRPRACGVITEVDTATLGVPFLDISGLTPGVTPVPYDGAVANYSVFPSPHKTASEDGVGELSDAALTIHLDPCPS